MTLFYRWNWSLFGSSILNSTVRFWIQRLRR